MQYYLSYKYMYTTSAESVATEKVARNLIPAVQKFIEAEPTLSSTQPPCILLLSLFLL